MGIDLTPEPGLKSPTNFAGLARTPLLLEVHQALEGMAQQHPAGCSEPLVLAYGHYPLSTVDYPNDVAGPLGAMMHASRSALSMQGLTAVRGGVALGCGGEGGALGTDTLHARPLVVHAKNAAPCPPLCAFLALPLSCWRRTT